MKETKYLKLQKPDYTEPADIGVINLNMDVVDKQIANILGSGQDGEGVDINQGEKLPTKPEEAKGSIIQTLGRFGNMFKNITGKSNWWEKPKLTIEEIVTQLDNNMQYRNVITSSTQASKDGYYYVNNGDSSFPQKWGKLIYLKESNAQEECQIFISPHSHAESTNATGIYVRYKPSTFGWAPWKQIATSEPPTEYDLPLASGISMYNASTYSKTQDNVVTINANLTLNTGSYPNLLLLGTLPVGYRPINALEFPAVYYHPITIGLAQVMPNGQINARIDGATATMKDVKFHISFVAAK